MARAICRTRLWVWSAIGFMCALFFGRDALAGGPKAAKYGIRPRPPIEEVEKPAPETNEEKPATALEESEDWKLIVEAWKFAMPFAVSGKSTRAERKDVTDKLAAATEAAKKLAAGGLLTEPEAGLLASEAEGIKGEVFRNPPTDYRATCYVMVALVPARQSLARLTQRLPLLEKLAEGGKVHPAAIEKILGSIEADLAVLGDEKALENLFKNNKKARAAAVKTREEVEAAIEKIKALVAKAKVEATPPVDGPKGEDIPRPTCYKPMPLPRREPQSARELDARLSLLDALATGGRLAPEAAQRAREAILRKIKLL